MCQIRPRLLAGAFLGSVYTSPYHITCTFSVYGSNPVVLARQPWAEIPGLLFISLDFKTWRLYWRSFRLSPAVPLQKKSAILQKQLTSIWYRITTSTPHKSRLVKLLLWWFMSLATSVVNIGLNWFTVRGESWKPVIHLCFTTCDKKGRDGDALWWWYRCMWNF